VRGVKTLAGIAVLGLLLGGCATSNMEKEWDCGVVEGIGCKSIADIQNTIVRAGKAPVADYLGASVNPGVDLQYQGVPMWERDQIMKIYVADFIDSSNNYHAESVVYTVIREAGWALK